MKPVRIQTKKFKSLNYLKTRIAVKKRKGVYRRIENIDEIKAELPSLSDYMSVADFGELARCKYVDENGKRCQHNTVQKQDFCKAHGGKSRLDLVDPSTLIPDEVLKTTPGNSGAFDPDKHPMAYIKLSYIGKSPEEIATIFHVGLRTINNWAERYESMYEAKQIGDTMYKAFWIDKGVGNLDNKDFNTNLYKYLTGNLIGFSEKTETRVHQTGTTGVLLIPTPPVSPQEWEKQVQEQSQVLDMETFDE
jgi:hypothetical protein